MKRKYYELKRYMRLWRPSPLETRLIETIGRWWLITHGWKREYKVGGYMIDLACPRKRLAIEADGGKYHIDIVREQQRDDQLRALGWKVLHFRYQHLKGSPSYVKKTVRQAYYAR